MAGTSLNPYLNFPSKTKEAMQFYKDVLGGELTLQTFGEANPDFPEEKKHLIMHAKLVNDSITLMASDGMKDEDVVNGTSVHLSLSGTDEDYLRKAFDGLSAGGEVKYPLEKAPWGDFFGMLTDKYGIHWMVNIGSNG